MSLRNARSYVDLRFRQWVAIPLGDRPEMTGWMASANTSLAGAESSFEWSVDQLLMHLAAQANEDDTQAVHRQQAEALGSIG
jgi:hypothetical protein